MFNRRTNRNLHMNHCSLRPSQSSPPSSTVQTGSGVTLQDSAFNGKVSIYRADLKNQLDLTVELLQESFSTILNEKKEQGVKCILSLFVVFCKAEKEEEVTDPPIVIKSDVFACLRSTDVNKKLSAACEQIKERIDEFVRNGSGWVIHHFDRIDLGLLKYDPLKASSYVKLPYVLRRKHACVNVQNLEDNKCFLWSILASLHPIESHSYRLQNYLEYENEINMRNINYPVKVKDLKRIENQNPDISINIFGFEDEKIFPIRITEKVNANHHVNLLMITDDNNTHYVWIKHFSRLVRSQTTKYKGKKWFYNFCLNGFIREDLLNNHVALCRVRVLTFFFLCFSMHDYV